VCSDAQHLPMDCYPYALALVAIKMVGGCAIFVKARKSGLDLLGFGNKFCEGDNCGDRYLE